MLRQRLVRIRTKNFTSESLRGSLYFPTRSIVRLGSTTQTKRIFPNSFGKYRILEVNSVDAVNNSRDKLLMKQCFDKAEIKHAKWWTWEGFQKVSSQKETGACHDKLVAKLRNGFKGHGMALLDDEATLRKWASQREMSNYIIEHYYNYAREYRLHCTQKECFLAWRKLRRNGEEERWFFNSENCNWVGWQHKLFDRPSNWDKIVEHCLKAMKTTGLDLGAVDVRVQSSGNEDPDFIICEVNSAPALGEVGVDMYRAQIVRILNNKLKEYDKSN